MLNGGSQKVGMGLNCRFLLYYWKVRGLLPPATTRDRRWCSNRGGSTLRTGEVVRIRYASMKKLLLPFPVDHLVIL
jgi:hypothetical protein